MAPGPPPPARSHRPSPSPPWPSPAGRPSSGNAAPGLAVGAAGGGFLAVITARYGFDVWLLGCRRQGRFLSPGRAGGHRATTPQALADVPRPQPRDRLPAPRRSWAGGPTTAHPSGDVAASRSQTVPPGPWLGGYGDVVAAVRQTGATGVLVAVNHIPSGALHDLLHDVSAIGLPVHLSSGLTGFAHVPPAHHAGGPRAVPGPRPAAPQHHPAGGQADDRPASSPPLALVVSLPVLLAAAARHQARTTGARCCSGRTRVGPRRPPFRA